MILVYLHEYKGIFILSQNHLFLKIVKTMNALIRLSLEPWTCTCKHAYMTYTDHIHTLRIITSNSVTLIIIMGTNYYTNLHSKMPKSVGSGFTLPGSHLTIANNYLCVFGQVIQHL